MLYIYILLLYIIYLYILYIYNIFLYDQSSTSTDLSQPTVLKTKNKTKGEMPLDKLPLRKFSRNCRLERYIKR